MSDLPDWQKLVNKIRQLTGFSLVEISDQSDVGIDVLQSMSAGRAKDPRFSNGLKLVVFAGELGVKVNDILRSR